jgi:hypothetical protein
MSLRVEGRESEEALRGRGRRKNMSDMSPDRYNETETKEERRWRLIHREMATKVIDDDLPFNPFQDVESLVRVSVHPLNGTSEFFARLQNGTVIGLSANEFRQIHFLLFGASVAHVTGLSMDEISPAFVWVVDKSLRDAIQEKSFSWECPVWKVWRRLDVLKSAVAA